ncbi:MAG: hypothetical protein AB1779_04880 [Candidatus Thermoplasmatota archaeon]
MKSYIEIDENGEWKITEYDNGIKERILIKSSLKRLNDLSLLPKPQEPTPINLDDLKKIIEYSKKQGWI